MSGGEIQEFGPFIVASGFDDALVLWDALLAFYLERRPVRVSHLGLYPETTISDVQQVAGLLTAEVEKLPKDALGRADTIARWNAYRARVQQATAGRFMFAPFGDNARFWLRETRRVAIDASTSGVLPTKSEAVLDAVRARIEPTGEDSSLVPGAVTELFDDIAGLVDDAIDAGADLAADALDTAKGVGVEAKGLLKDAVGGVSDAVVTPVVDTIGKPLLIGAAVVGGLLIVPTLLDGRKERKAA